VIESPQFGFILATGLDQDQGRLHKIVKNKSLFCNIEFLDFLGEIGFLEPGKLSLTDPFVWQISTFMAWSMENGKKGCLWVPVFSGEGWCSSAKYRLQPENLQTVSETEGLFGFSG